MKIFINQNVFLNNRRSKLRGYTRSRFEHGSQARIRSGAYCLQGWETRKAVYLSKHKLNI